MTTANQCCNCGDAVGVEAKQIPFVERTPTGQPFDIFCPACFCYHRVLLEPGRYQPGCYVAVVCGRCGLMTIDRGPLGCCAQCGSRNVRVAGPKVPRAEAKSA
jgi:hypothetical protein